MKKLVALILVVCMMITSAAFAEVILERPVLQDEMPPMVVTYEDEAGNVIVATLYDAQGNVLGKVADDGSLVITDVHFRAEEDRLTGAYEGVMYDVHHSDVKAILHEGVVKVDINETIAGIDDLHAHDLVMYEFFDVMLNGEAGALLADGAYLEVTFELIPEWSLPLVIIFTPDGESWKVLEYTKAGENQFTVHLTETGSMALLQSGRSAFRMGEEEKYNDDNQVEQSDMIFIDNGIFTPSVYSKPAPIIITFTDIEENYYVGTIKNAEGEDVTLVPDRDYLLVTPVSERDYIYDIQTHEHLEWAFDGILKANDVGNLPADIEDEVIAAETDAGIEDQTIAAELNAELAKINANLTHEDMVVRDLFEVSVYGEYVDYFYNEDHYLAITFDANVDPNKPFAVLYSSDSVHWNVLSSEEITVHKNGNVTLNMYDLGAVAFLVEGDERMEGLDLANTVLSPN